MSVVHFENASQARAHFKDLLDAAQQGRPATVRRDSGAAAVVDAARLRSFLLSSLPARAEVLKEADGWSAFLHGAPVSADGATFDEALTELVDALRAYADDWEDHLREAANHRRHWALVQLVRLCDDDQLRRWLTSSPA